MRMISISVLCVSLALLAFLPGCCINPGNGVVLVAPAQLPDGTVGEYYEWSFCEPDSARSGAVCGGLTPATNPTGGKPPYSMIYGKGLHPTGINLQLNGMFNGTPEIEGSYDFEVCARDGFGEQGCEQVRMDVLPAPEQISVDPDDVVVEAPLCFSSPCEASTKVTVSSSAPWKVLAQSGSATDDCYDTVSEFSRYWSICPTSGGAGDTEVEISTMVYGESTPNYLDEKLLDRGSTWIFETTGDGTQAELHVVLELPYSK